VCHAPPPSQRKPGIRPEVDGMRVAADAPAYAWDAATVLLACWGPAGRQVASAIVHRMVGRQAVWAVGSAL